MLQVSLPTLASSTPLDTPWIAYLKELTAEVPKKIIATYFESHSQAEYLTWVALNPTLQVIHLTQQVQPSYLSEPKRHEVETYAHYFQQRLVSYLLTLGEKLALLQGQAQSPWTLRQSYQLVFGTEVPLPLIDIVIGSQVRTVPLAYESARLLQTLGAKLSFRGTLLPLLALPVSHPLHHTPVIHDFPVALTRQHLQQVVTPKLPVILTLRSQGYKELQHATSNPEEAKLGVAVYQAVTAQEVIVTEH